MRGLVADLYNAFCKYLLSFAAFNNYHTMKRVFLFVFFSAALLAGCKKDKDKAANFQLLDMEIPMGNLRFSYNDQSQLTKINIDSKMDNGSFKPQGYVELVYNNGFPAYAENYQVTDNGAMAHASSMKFVLDDRNNIAYVAIQGYNVEGNPASNSKDTTFLKFNANNQLISITNDGYSQFTDFGYDSRGNLVIPGFIENQLDSKYTYSFEQSYDNNINPFRYNGLGIMLMTLGIGQLETPDQLLSYNNPLMLKMNAKNERLDEGVVSETDYITMTFSREFTYDEYNIPKKAMLTQTVKQANQGEEPEEHTMYNVNRYTVIRK